MVTAEARRGQVQVDPVVLEKFPSYHLRVVYAFGVKNALSDPRSFDVLRAAAAAAEAAFSERLPSEHPHISAWRRAYSEFGAKPSSFPCSVEALLRRTLRPGSGGVPAVNCLVDLYNAVSLRHVVPVGGEDLDQLKGVVTLRFARGDEPFDLPDAHGRYPSFPLRGEVVWADEEGVTCRNWNWRQGRRTRLTQATRNAYFLLEALDPTCTEQDLEAAATDLTELLRTFSSAAEIVVERFPPGAKPPAVV